jgi:hypothetical protein
LKLYERNTALSEGLYGVIQTAEVAMRNSMNRVLVGYAGSSWFDSISFDSSLASKITEAKDELNTANRPIAAGRVVAGLRLGFWTSLVSPKHEKQIWVPYLYRAFPNAFNEIEDSKGGKVKRPKPRAEIAQKLDSMRILRNRIAHHEPIFHLDLWESYNDTLRVIRWFCAASADWTSQTNCFKTRFHQKVAPAAVARSVDPPRAHPTPGQPEPKR